MLTQNYGQWSPPSKRVFFCFISFFFWFFLDFGLSRLTSLQFIQNHVAGFYKPTIPQTPPSHLQDYSTCNNARLEFSTIFVPSFDTNEYCLKNGLHSGGLNPQPFSHESSAWTTRPRFFWGISLDWSQKQSCQLGCFGCQEGKHFNVFATGCFPQGPHGPQGPPNQF